MLDGGLSAIVDSNKISLNIIQICEGNALREIFFKKTSKSYLRKQKKIPGTPKKY
jgi:hypothetical protein